MPRGKELNETEKKVINNLENQRYNISQIAKALGRSRHVIRNYINNKENYGQNKRPGRPRAISERNRRALLRIASNSALTARQIAAEAGVQAHIRTVRRILQGSRHIQRKKLKRKPSLTAVHKQARLQFAKEHIHWKKRWYKVLFSDEKKFNLDGPDGFSFYFHDLRKEERVLSRRQMGGGTVMVWAGIGYEGKTDIKFISGRLNATTYRELINEQLTLHGERISGKNFVFQHDNAPIHKAAVVQNYFATNNIAILDWPACSPDLNIIENVWGDIARTVYQGGQQYQTIADLKNAIIRSWCELSQVTIQELYRSLPDRMTEVIFKHGGTTHY